MYSTGSVNVQDGTHSVRRSLRVAQMTPSKLNFIDDTDADSDATVKPLRLLGQRGRSRSRSPTKSRGRTPTKKQTTPSGSRKSSSSNNSTFLNIPSIPQGQLPYRLDTPKPISDFPPQPDSRMKHVQNLDLRDPFSESPPKLYNEWPTDSLVTPAVIQSKKLSQPFPEETQTVKLTRLKPSSRETMPAVNGIFMNRDKHQSKQSINIDVKTLSSALVLSIGFLMTLFYRGEIIDYSVVKLRNLSGYFKSIQTVPYSNLKNEISSLCSDLDKLKRDLARRPDHDMTSLVRRIDQIELKEDTAETIIKSLQASLSDIKESDNFLDNSNISDKIVELKENISQISSQISKVDAKNNQLDSTLNQLEQTVFAIQASEELLKSALNDFEKSLPEKMLVRISSNGEVIFDHRLYTYLQHHFASTPIDSEHIPDEFTQTNVKSIENFFQGKLDDLEHKILHRSEIVDLINETVKTQLKLFKSPNVENSGNFVNSVLEQVMTKLRTNQVDGNEARPNLASEAAGCRPILALSSKTYNPNNSEWPLSNYFNWWYRSKPHRTTLSSDNSLSNCWAFSGSIGHLTIQLIASVIPDSFSLCHLSKEYKYDRSSAPELFQVHAVPNLSVPEETVLLGSYTYDLNGDDCQHFSIQFKPKESFKYYQLRVLSNHGKSEYTCIYQFGIHSSL